MIMAFSTRPRASSMAIRTASTIASVWGLLFPVRGSDETILIVPLNWPWFATTSPPPPGLATGEAPGDAPGEGDPTATTGGGGAADGACPDAGGGEEAGGGIGVGALAAGDGALAAGCADGAAA